MHYAGSFKAVQAIIEKLGSEYNLALTRLGSVKKCIFVEGEDVKILSKLQNIVFPETQLSLEQLPIVKLGGWSRFQEALGTARLFYEETRGEIQTYCILDRDYHTEEEIQDLYNKAKENHLNIHIWERKELENYILTPKSIYRAAKCRKINFEDFCDELFNELNQLYDQTLNAMLDEYAKRDKSKNPSYHMKQAQAALNPRWSTLEGRLSCANGKNMISLINTWIKNRFNRECSLAKLISNMTVDDILPEMVDVLKSICF